MKANATADFFMPQDIPAITGSNIWNSQEDSEKEFLSKESSSNTAPLIGRATDS